jgi:hypothetical protein
MATPRKASATAKPAAQRKPKQRRAPQRRAPPQQRAEPHDDNVLESLGKAVSEPVRDAADPEADEKRS